MIYVYETSHSVTSYFYIILYSVIYRKHRLLFCTMKTQNHCHAIVRYQMCYAKSDQHIVYGIYTFYQNYRTKWPAVQHWTTQWIYQRDEAFHWEFFLRFLHKDDYFEHRCKMNFWRKIKSTNTVFSRWMFSFSV